MTGALAAVHDALLIALLAKIALSAWAGFALWILENPRRGTEEEISAGLLYRAVQILATLVHRLRVEGVENIPKGRSVGPLIVVANHTAGIDPLLVQAACPFEVRWMMAQDMMKPGAEELWAFTRVIPVDRQGRDRTSVRAGLRHLAQGGVLGIFPEGAIARPARTLKAFYSGVGLIVSRSGASVLPMVIQGTPEGVAAGKSLITPSMSVLRVLPMVRFEKGTDAATITRALEELFAHETGWKLVHGALET